MSKVKTGFKSQPVKLTLDKILPLRPIERPKKRTKRYWSILSSIKAVGIIEPLIVYPQKGKSGMYILLDGHLRFYALKNLGIDTVDCLVSKEDESYTYNAKLNRLSPIQEHKMIRKAVKEGVPPERIAQVLNISVKSIQAQLNLLDGIHEEAVEILKDKQISPSAIRILRKVMAVRQIEMAELMVSANNYTKGYAEALFFATTDDQKLNPEKQKKSKKLSRTDIAKLETEIGAIGREMKALEHSYGDNVVQFTFAKGYLKKLLANVKVAKFLKTRHSDIHEQFEILAATETL